MKNILTLFFIFFMVGFSSCSSSLKVTSDYDRSVSFSEIKTFRIEKKEAEKNSISALNQERIYQAIRSELQRKNLSETDNADVIVHVSTILKDKIALNSTTDYYGYGGFYRPYMWGPGYSSSTNYDIRNYKEGSLIIDIISTRTNKLIWEGIGNKEIDAPLKNPDKEIGEAITKILASFPPGQSGTK